MLRPIRSYVRREGRLTEAQRRALAALLPRYGIEVGESLIDLAAVFGRRAPVVLEIGFGNGEALLAMAKAHPENDYLGIEVYRPGVGRLLRVLEEAGIANVRVIVADAQEVLAQRLADGSLAAVHLFFPDPWPKRRHHKRRLVQLGFVELVRRKLAPGGVLRLATDWQDYAEHMLAVLSQADGWENAAGEGRFAPRPPQRPLTRFEQRGQALGHRVWDLVFRKTL